MLLVNVWVVIVLFEVVSIVVAFLFLEGRGCWRGCWLSLHVCSRIIFVNCRRFNKGDIVRVSFDIFWRSVAFLRWFSYSLADWFRSNSLLCCRLLPWWASFRIKLRFIIFGSNRCRLLSLFFDNWGLLFFWSGSRYILLSLEIDKNTGFFIVIDAHLTIVFIVVLMLKERDPLRVAVQASIEYNVLGDGDWANHDGVLAHCLRDDPYHIAAYLRLKWDLYRICWSIIGYNEHIEQIAPQVHIKGDITTSESFHLLLQHDIVYPYCHRVR